MIMLLGDRVEMIIMALLPVKVYGWIHGQNCGCTERKKWLNKMDRKFRKWLYEKSGA